MFVLIAALPIAVAAALVAWSDGLILWTAVARARPAVLAAVLPLGAMAFRAFLTTHLVAVETFLPISAVAGAAAATALFVTRPDMAKTVQSAVFFGLFGAIGAYGLAVLADVAFDTSTGQTNATTVRDKHVSRGKSTTYYLQLGPWAGQPGGDTNVSEVLYDEVPVGGFVCVVHHPGALGVTWYDVGLCPGEKPLQTPPAPPPPPPPPGAGEDRFYPDRAQRMEVEGSAIVECAVTDTLQLAACHTLAETPPGYGFGDAAVARLQSPSFRLTRLPKDGGRTFRTSVQFKLQR